MSGPQGIVSRPVPSALDVERAVATLAALVPPSLLVLLARHLDAMKLERAIGDLDVSLHLYHGDVRSASFRRVTHWQRSERPEAQAPAPSSGPKP